MWKIYKRIDIDTWNRKEYFQHYFQSVPCTYSMTANIDITNLMHALSEANCSFASAMIYLLAAEVNRHEEFRTFIDEDGQIGIYDLMHPSYTFFHKDTETFSCLWTQFDSCYQVFQKNYHDDIRKYGMLQGIAPKPDMPQNVFDISNIPWTSFSSFNLNPPNGSSYLLPIFTSGKYFRQENRILLPISVQVHHAVCDGFHVCRFLNELQEQADHFEKQL